MVFLQLELMQIHNMNCQNIRRVNYYFFDANGRRIDLVRYYDVIADLEITARMALRCRIIETVNIACATIC
jgi:hypothetical protein